MIFFRKQPEPEEMRTAEEFLAEQAKLAGVDWSVEQCRALIESCRRMAALVQGSAMAFAEAALQISRAMPSFEELAETLDELRRIGVDLRDDDQVVRRKRQRVAALVSHAKIKQYDGRQIHRPRARARYTRARKR